MAGGISRVESCTELESQKAMSLNGTLYHTSIYTLSFAKGAQGSSSAKRARFIPCRLQMVHKGPVRPKGPGLYPVICTWCTRVQFGQKGPVYTILFAYATQGSSLAKGPSLLMNLTEWYGKSTNNTCKL